jgi:hypothetical protein
LRTSPQNLRQKGVRPAGLGPCPMFPSSLPIRPERLPAFGSRPQATTTAPHVIKNRRFPE